MYKKGVIQLTFMETTIVALVYIAVIITNLGWCNYLQRRESVKTFYVQNQ